MKPLLILSLILCLAGCRDDELAQDTAPLPLTEEAVGHFCQMNLLEHPGPKAQIHLEGLPGMPLFFSQVRDGVAYLRLPEQSHRVLAVWVNDMGAEGATWEEPGIANWIAAESAFYVVGAAVEGGMGAPELVPFGDKAKAVAFAGDHGGAVLGFGDIPDSAVMLPEDNAPDADFDKRLRALSDKTKG